MVQVKESRPGHDPTTRRLPSSRLLSGSVVTFTMACSGNAAFPFNEGLVGNVQPTPDDPLLASQATCRESNGPITHRTRIELNPGAGVDIPPGRLLSYPNWRQGNNYVLSRMRPTARGSTMERWVPCPFFRHPHPVVVGIFSGVAGLAVR